VAPALATNARRVLSVMPAFLSRCPSLARRRYQ
jgi:hypothetical protein